MTRRRDPIDERFEDLLREQVAPAAPDPMSGLVRDLRRAYAAPLSMEVQNRQIADLIIAGREMGTTRPGALRRRVNAIWYRFSQRFVAGSVLGKVILAASVATAATTGMAATGHLPNPLQIAVSAAAAQIGVSIPTPAPGPPPNGGSVEPPPPNRPAPVQLPAAGPSQAPAPPARNHSQVQPTQTEPAPACDPAVLSESPAAPPPPGAGGEDALKSLQHLSDEQLKLDDLLKCLVPSPTPPPAPSSGESGSSGDLEELLRNLLGGG